jgi:hypothetical protein
MLDSPYRAPGQDFHLRSQRPCQAHPSSPTARWSSRPAASPSTTITCTSRITRTQQRDQAFQTPFDLRCVRPSLTTGLHDDQTPSLQLYGDGTWYCFGDCQTGGSVYDFASRLWRMETNRSCSSGAGWHGNSSWREPPPCPAGTWLWANLGTGSLTAVPPCIRDDAAGAAAGECPAIAAIGIAAKQSRGAVRAGPPYVANAITPTRRPSRKSNRSLRGTTLSQCAPEMASAATASITSAAVRQRSRSVGAPTLRVRLRHSRTGRPRCVRS